MKHSDALSERNKSTTGSSSIIRCFCEGSFWSVSNIQNVVTSISYLSSSNALEALFAGVNISSISGCTFQFMTKPVKLVLKPVLFKPPDPPSCVWWLLVPTNQSRNADYAIYSSFDMLDEPFITDVNFPSVKSHKALNQPICYPSSFLVERCSLIQSCSLLSEEVS